MILYCLFHNLDLFDREPFFQAGIGCQNLTATHMVIGAMAAHAQIVVGSNGINHVDVSSRSPNQLERIAYNSCDVQ